MEKQEKPELKGAETPAEEKAAEEQPHRRRRRAERYEEKPEESEAFSGFDNAEHSETAREVANRYRQRKKISMLGDTTRIPAQAEGTEGKPAWKTQGFSRERVGYASGHMGGSSAQRARMSEAGRARLAAESGLSGAEGAGTREPGRETYAAGGKAGPYGRTPGAVRETEYGARQAALRRPEPPRRKRKALTAAVTALLAAGAVILGLLMVPEDMGGPLGSIRRGIGGLMGGNTTAAQRREITISVIGQDQEEVPAQVDFAVVTGKDVSGVRLVSEDGSVLLSDQMISQREDDILWELSWYAEQPYSGQIGVQVRTGDAWTAAPCTVEVKVLAASAEPKVSELPDVVATEAPALTPEPVWPEDPEEDPGDAEMEGAGEGTEPEAGKGQAQLIPEPGTDPDDPGRIPENGSGAPNPEAPAEESPEDEGEAPAGDEGNAPAEEGLEDEDGAQAGEWPWDEGEAPAEEESGDGTEQPRESGEDAFGPETQAETAGNGEQPEQAAQAGADAQDQETPPARPLMTVTAAESADPSLIATTVIYNGNKKVAEYARADVEKIHMPVLGEYTKQKMGILTFRTDAFRQNASIGTVKGMNSLDIAWTAEAGSIRGAGQTYYGIGWVGQPAIVKWSKEVREQSEMYDAKKEKSGLKEVIAAGQDGRIYFLDLSDGTPTRNSIKVGYPLRAAPSVHPGGAPYLTVGQFARKMASGQGRIGLRQYNLYMLKELSLIDGLDEKKNRPYNKVGSFETSALIDRTVKSPVMITAGTNGMLYLVNLNGEFDFNAGTYNQSPTMVVMKSKAKGEKDAATAVEASIAMYDRYVYYADMGGFLRCVDTNTLTTAWAVSLGDSVESTPALDWHGENGLDLYTATLLSLRKKGNAEVRCFDALSGEERWSAAFGVRKDTKNRTVSGFRASPVIGQNGLSDWIYYTVNNLSQEGREQLGLGSETAALVALNKEDGSVAWAAGLSGNGYSSPVAVYDADGNGAVIQCAGDGSILMLDGETGEELASLKIDGAIEASPAVYDGMMVIGTTEKNKNNIYGIQIN